MSPAGRYINPDLRQFVAERAEHLCEYCLIHEDDTYLGCEIDHIISLKHGGSSDADNLAYACTFCNRHKGSDVGSVLNGAEFVRFYNPRKDRWAEHFQLDGLNIQALTSIGAATAKILLFNTDERLLERESLIDLGRYPSLAAMKLL
ncbi:MAG: HNH endonuclease [Candidatus Electrothrix sp. EH2]|nr:HNH endonuclease [Candidatus Electrothrix sp. EH2]